MSKQAHTVTADPAGFFSVLSGNSGKTYRVYPHGGDLATCDCPGYHYAHHCSHVDAVREFAAGVLGVKAFSEAMVATRHPRTAESLLASFDREEGIPGTMINHAFEDCSSNQFCAERGQSCHLCGGPRENHREPEQLREHAEMDANVFSRIERSERDPYGRYLTPWPGEKVELL